MARYREVFADGCNGMRLGGEVEVELVDGVATVDGLQFSSRNGDGLLEDHEEGQSYLVPLG